MVAVSVLPSPLRSSAESALVGASRSPTAAARASSFLSWRPSPTRSSFCSTTAIACLWSTEHGLVQSGMHQCRGENPDAGAEALLVCASARGASPAVVARIRARPLLDLEQLLAHRVDHGF